MIPLPKEQQDRLSDIRKKYLIRIRLVSFTVRSMKGLRLEARTEYLKLQKLLGYREKGTGTG